MKILMYTNNIFFDLHHISLFLSSHSWMAFLIQSVMSNRNWYIYEGFFFGNPSYGPPRPWTIPKTSSEITISFSSLTISFSFLIAVFFSYELFFK